MSHGFSGPRWRRTRGTAQRGQGQPWGDTAELINTHSSINKRPPGSGPKLQSLAKQLHSDCETFHYSTPYRMRQAVYHIKNETQDGDEEINKQVVL